jgi:hypothetical protein
MEYSIYLITAIVGCTMLALQVILMLVGLGGDHDGDVGHADADAHVDVDHDGDVGDVHEGHGNLFFKILSLKALCAFFGLFGLTGLALHQEGVTPVLRILAASGAGIGGFALVGYLVKWMYGLTSSGNVNVRNAVGKPASVYLRIPAKGEGSGKVTLELQGRSMEIEAVSEGEMIPTGAKVVVAEVIGENTLKVVPI